jgi:exopolysaccharide biosynthesis polyprenyl glycosylphosphotransferase
VLVESRVIPWVDQRCRRSVGTVLRPSAVLATGDAAALLASVAATEAGGWRCALFAVLALAVLAGWGHHRPRIVPSIAQDLGPIVAHLGPVLLLLCLLPAAPADVAGLLRSGTLGIMAVVATRAVLYALIRRLRGRGSLVERTLIVGAGATGVDLARALLDHPEYGLEPVGFLDSFDDDDLPLPLLGQADALSPVLAEHDVRRVIVAFGATREPDLVAIIRACGHASVDIHVLPRFFELGAAPQSRDTDNVWGIPVVRLRRSLLRGTSRRCKRVFDVVVAGALLVLTAPLCAVIHALVRLSSPGPVLFRQRRVGENGERIEVLKFRSLRLNDDSDTTWSVVDDDRRTPIGAVLRKTSLDELPQLLNVLKGEMSLVGPRPERPVFVDQFSADVPRYPDRHRAPAGLTGWAQVHGLRGDTSIEERARFDNQYIEYWSMWNDIVILARTAREIMAGGERKVA